MAKTTSELVTRVMATVRRYMARRGWAFEQQDRQIIAGSIRGDNGLLEWMAHCADDGALLWFCTNAPVYVPRRRRAAVAEYIALVNWGLSFGHFEMNWDDGKVAFRTCIPLAARRPPVAALAHQTFASIWQMDWHLPGLMAVAHGKISPKRALRRVTRQIARDLAAWQGDVKSRPKLHPKNPGPNEAANLNTGEPDQAAERRRRLFESEN